MAITNLARTPGLAQFNKLNKVFITVLGPVEDASWLNHEHYLYHEVMIDIANEKIVGDYNNYQIVPIADQPTEILEGHLNALATEKILTTYPYGRQLNTIGALLEKLADSAGIECEELKTMNDFVQEVLHANKLRKEFYESDPDYQYISTEKFEELYAKQLEGGIADNAGTVADL
jgi:Rad3-related DNA helicase